MLYILDGFLLHVVNKIIMKQSLLLIIFTLLLFDNCVILYAKRNRTNNVYAKQYEYNENVLESSENSGNII